MFTVCPRCALPLAVTVADLRAGQGYVRCGRCGNVFNALLALADETGPAGVAGAGEDPAAFADMDTASATLSRPGLTDSSPTGEQPESALEWVELAIDPVDEAMDAPASPPAPVAPPESNAAAAASGVTEGTASAAPAAAWAPPALRLIDSPPRPPPSELAAGSSDAIESASGAPAAQMAADLETTGEFTGTSTFETIILEGDTFLQTEETIPEEVMASELADVSRRIAAANDGYEKADGPGDPDDEDADVFNLYEDDDEDEEKDKAGGLAALREATGEFRHEANLGAASAEGTSAFRKPNLRPGWRSATIAALLAVLLGIQLINHWREDLATRPGWYGPMRGLASLLGEPLRPNWDLNAYDVRQLGAAPAGADSHELRVRLRLANVGSRTQALPLLRLTLLDRYGKAVSRGELQPSQYLPRELHGLEFIARDQRIDTEVRVQDPTQQASSFELDVCVAAAGGLRCAGDTPTVASRS